MEKLNNDNTSAKPQGRIGRLVDRTIALWDYVNTGIWSDTRRNWWINVLRTVNLSVNSFLNRDIQTQACAMTYRTMLAVVPALALLLAIGRGFGISQVLQDELYHLFPAQHVAIKYSINFVDSYLTQTSEGIFLGVGIVFLLWTMISLLGNVEDTFNYIWGQKTGRSIWRKITDYTALLLILPILMICASGISLMLSSTLNAIFHFDFMTPVISAVLEGASILVTWLFFAAAYMLIPNTRVKFKNAFISGAIAGSGFLVLQWLFVTGTLYVTRYNAIYGSFAFLPLLLLWMQLAWVICLAGAVICYSSQNVFAFSLEREVANISPQYEAKVVLAIATIITHRFVDGQPAPTAHDLMNYYDLPARLVTNITDRLCGTGILSRVMIPGEKDVWGFQPAVEPSKLTVSYVTQKLYTEGLKDFIPNFRKNFQGVSDVFTKIETNFAELTGTTLLSEISIQEKNQ